MKKILYCKRIIACALVGVLVVPFAVIGNLHSATAIERDEQVFSVEELDQMLAPIALYPDALLAQILTASTYPLQIVSAARFVKGHEGYAEEALMEAAQDQDWEPSVKALLQFPDVLARMDQEIEWTTKLGDAFLAQQSDVMDSVQRLRQKAHEHGNLSTTKEQVVKVESRTRIIIIEPADPEIVYVPVYDPLIVYGPWWYPAFPPFSFYSVLYAPRIFFTRIFIGFTWGAWGIWGCDWHHHYVHIDVYHYNRYTRTHYRRYTDYHLNDRNAYRPWAHDPRFRMGVTYRGRKTIERFGGRLQQPVSAPKPIVPAVRGADRGVIRAPKRIAPAARGVDRGVIRAPKQIAPVKRGADRDIIGPAVPVVPAPIPVRPVVKKPGELKPDTKVTADVRGTTKQPIAKDAPKAAKREIVVKPLQKQTRSKNDIVISVQKTTDNLVETFREKVHSLKTQQGLSREGDKEKAGSSELCCGYGKKKK